MIQQVSGNKQLEKQGNLLANPVKTFSGQDLAFQTLLKDRLGQENVKQGVLQFSKHAAQRVEQRGIQVTPGLMDSLNQAVEKARSKGAKDVVIIGDSNAFIVNIPNNVVVTTLAGNEMKDNIFTNIDSAVLI